MEWLSLIVVGVLAFAQLKHYLRRDLVTWLLLVAAYTLWLCQPVQTYAVPGLMGLLISLLVGTLLTVGIEMEVVTL
jgi:hypothetical protein